MLKGWSPFLLVSLLIFLWARPEVAAWRTFKALERAVPYLASGGLRMPPVVPKPAPEDAIADLNILAVPGTAVFLSAVLAALLLGMSPRESS